MGQPITVVARPSSTPGIIRYETNRALSGMGHERYHSLDDILRDRPVDELAKRLLEHGGVDSVHINGNVITVKLAAGSMGEGVDDVISDLYLFYGGQGAGVPAPPSDDSASAPETAAEPADATSEDISDAPAPTEEAGSDAETPSDESVAADEPVPATPDASEPRVSAAGPAPETPDQPDLPTTPETPEPVVPNDPPEPTIPNDPPERLAPVEVPEPVTPPEG